MSYGVAIVVDPDFGATLQQLADRVHVWICATPTNESAAAIYRRDHPGHSLERGVTTFRVDDQESAEASLLKVLADVDLHHGEYSHALPWDRMEIYGVEPTPSIRAALAKYNATDIVANGHGFSCRRSNAGAA